MYNSIRALRRSNEIFVVTRRLFLCISKGVMNASTVLRRGLVDYAELRNCDHGRDHHKTRGGIDARCRDIEKKEIARSYTRQLADLICLDLCPLDPVVITRISDAIGIEFHRVQYSCRWCTRRLFRLCLCSRVLLDCRGPLVSSLEDPLLPTTTISSYAGTDCERLTCKRSFTSPAEGLLLTPSNTAARASQSSKV